MRTELKVGSLSTHPPEIPFFSLLCNNTLDGEHSIEGVHAILAANKRDPTTVADIANYTFGTEIKPEQVQVVQYIPDKLDELFAGEFGFRIFPVAYAALKGDGVQAWISPALVPAGHPLCSRTNSENSVHIVLRDDVGQSRTKGFLYYVRLRVKDQPHVLAQVSQGFGDAGISIKEMRQPQAEEGSKAADMAFLLWPCQAQVLQSALTAISGLKGVMRINVPLRAFNKTE